MKLWILLFDISLLIGVCPFPKEVQHKFNTSPKLWFLYVHKITENVIEHNVKFHTKKTLIRVLRVLPSVSKVFVLKSHEVIDMENSVFYRAPLAKLFASDKGPKLFKLPTLRTDHLFHIDQTSYILVDEKLRLKLDLNVVYFASFALSHCFFGNLTLTSFMIRRKEQFCYCGQYPFATIYPRSRYIQFKIVTVGYNAHRVFTTYSILDSDTISSQRTHNVTNSQLLSIWVLENEFAIYTFHVHVQKYKFILLLQSNFSFEKIRVWDGPDHNSPVLTPVQEHKYVTSAFQCTVQITSVWQERFQKAFSYSTSSHIANKMITVRSNGSVLLSFPMQHVPQSAGLTFIVAIHTPPDLHVNLQVLTIANRALRSSMCSFGGLSVYDKLNTTTTEISTLCQPHNNHYKSRSVYSKNSNIVLVFYSYTSHFKAGIQLSATACKCVHFNAWQYQKSCKTPYQFHSSPFCLNFLQNVTNSSPLTLAAALYELLASVADGQCVVMQLVYSVNTEVFELIDPSFDMELAPVDRPGMQTEIVLEGILKGDFRPQILLNSMLEKNELFLTCFLLSVRKIVKSCLSGYPDFPKGDKRLLHLTGKPFHFCYNETHLGGASSEGQSEQGLLHQNGPLGLTGYETSFSCPQVAVRKGHQEDLKARKGIRFVQETRRTSSFGFWLTLHWQMKIRLCFLLVELFSMAGLISTYKPNGTQPFPCQTLI